MKLIIGLFWLGLVLTVAMYIFSIVLSVFLMVAGAIFAGIAALFNLIFKK